MALCGAQMLVLFHQTNACVENSLTKMARREIFLFSECEHREACKMQRLLLNTVDTVASSTFPCLSQVTAAILTQNFVTFHFSVIWKTLLCWLDTKRNPFFYINKACWLCMASSSNVHHLRKGITICAPITVLCHQNEWEWEKKLFNERQVVLPACVKSPTCYSASERGCHIERLWEGGQKNIKKSVKKIDLVFTCKIMFGVLHQNKRD